MGVPGFYKWLFSSYGRNIQSEMKNSMVYAKSYDTPAGDFDNLYIDMNGVIHPAFHPEKAAKPTSFEDVFTRLFLYMDRLITVIQPKKVLYLSIDGPAPRAKMNQQRSRRFRSVIDHKRSSIITEGTTKAIEDYLKDIDVSTSAEIAEHVKSILEGLHKKKSKKSSNTSDNSTSEVKCEKERKIMKELEELSDSNIITPGTRFMEILTQYLIHYVSYRMSTDERWKKTLVIISDSNVPGEGEQKIFDFIREMRQFPGYDPNTSHVIHGLDADLVMLSLLTHEPNFYILREDVFDTKTEELKKPLGLFRVRPLRTKIAQSFLVLIKDHGMNLERIIDDFIFLLYMMGNDFIPQIASVDIGDSIDLVSSEYIQYQVSCNENEREYFTAPNGYINCKRLLHFIQSRLISYEDTIMPYRFQSWSFLVHKKKVTNFDSPCIPTDLYFNNTIAQEFYELKAVNKNMSFDEIFKKFMDTKREQMMKDVFYAPKNIYLTDDIQQCEEGWENKYYRQKFRKFNASDKEIMDLRRNTAYEYLRGVVWVWRYYTMTDTPSWSWFYPHFFGPFFRDFLLLTDEDLQSIHEFEYNAPYRPFDQLFSVLPPRSFHSLPTPYQGLETSKHLKRFFPTNFEIDLNGHHVRQSFKAIPLLPFIDEKLLVKATKNIQDALKPEEKKRNAFSHNIVLFTDHHKHLAKAISSEDFNRNSLRQNEKPDHSKGMHIEMMDKNFAGYLYALHEEHMLYPYVPRYGEKIISPFENKVLFPSYNNTSVHSAIYVMDVRKEKISGILPGFDFNHSPKLTESWYGTDKDVIGDNEEESDNETETQPELSHELKVEIIDNENAMIDVQDVEKCVGEQTEDEISKPIVNEVNTNIDIEPKLQSDESPKVKAVKRLHGYHKKELNQEDLYARAPNVPTRFAYCEKSQVFPRPLLEGQADFAREQNFKTNPKKRKRLSDDQVLLKTRHVSKGARKLEVAKEKKRARFT